MHKSLLEQDQERGEAEQAVAQPGPAPGQDPLQGLLTQTYNSVNLKKQFSYQQFLFENREVKQGGERRWFLLMNSRDGISREEH